MKDIKNIELKNKKQSTTSLIIAFFSTIKDEQVKQMFQEQDKSLEIMHMDSSYIIKEIKKSTEYKQYPGFKAIIDFFDNQCVLKKGKYSTENIDLKNPGKEIIISGQNKRALTGVYVLAISCLLLVVGACACCPKVLTAQGALDLGKDIIQNLRVSCSSFCSLKSANASPSRYDMMSALTKRAASLLMTSISCCLCYQGLCKCFGEDTHELQKINLLVLNDLETMANKPKNNSSLNNT